MIYRPPPLSSPNLSTLERLKIANGLLESTYTTPTIHQLNVIITAAAQQASVRLRPNDLGFITQFCGRSQFQ